MAKYKTSKKKSKKGSKSKPTRRRRSMGAMALNANSDLVMYGSMIGGFLLGDQINPQIDKIVDPTKVDQKLVSGGQVALGSAYMFLKKGKKNLLLTVASGVMIGAGVKRGLGAFGIGDIAINGYQNVPSVNGYQNVPSVNGTKRLPNGSGMGANFLKVPIGSHRMIGARR